MHLVLNREGLIYEHETSKMAYTQTAWSGSFK